MYDKSGNLVDVFPLIEMLFKHVSGVRDFAYKIQVLNDSGRNWKNVATQG